MKTTAIIATDLAGGVGHKGGLPWPRLARDMQRFRDATMGKLCLVGRKTAQGLPPLKGRELLIASRLHPNQWPTAGAIETPTFGIVPDVVHTLTSLKAEKDFDDESRFAEVMVIGGADVYRQALPLCDRMLLTVVHGTYEADTHLATPAVLCEGWVRLSSETHDPDESNSVRVTFSEWVRP